MPAPGTLHRCRVLGRRPTGPRKRPVRCQSRDLFAFPLRQGIHVDARQHGVAQHQAEENCHVTRRCEPLQVQFTAEAVNCGSGTPGEGKVKRRISLIVERGATAASAAWHPQKGWDAKSKHLGINLLAQPFHRLHGSPKTEWRARLPRLDDDDRSWHLQGYRCSLRLTAACCCQSSPWDGVGGVHGDPTLHIAALLEQTTPCHSCVNARQNTLDASSKLNENELRVLQVPSQHRHCNTVSAFVAHHTASPWEICTQSEMTRSRASKSSSSQRSQILNHAGRSPPVGHRQASYP